MQINPKSEFSEQIISSKSVYTPEGLTTFSKLSKESKKKFS